VYFSFSVIFSFLAIFQHLQCAFLIFHGFDVSRHIPGKTVFVSYFPRFSVFSPYAMSYNVHFSFFMFFSVSRHISCPTVCVSHFLLFSVFSILQVLECVFIIFHYFQFSLHTPGPTCSFIIFQVFTVVFVIFHVLQSVFHILNDIYFVAIFQVLQCSFLVSHLFQFFTQYSWS
jgi:hypothetical protein